MNSRTFIFLIFSLLQPDFSHSSIFPLLGESGEIVLGLGSVDCAVFSPDDSRVASGGSMGVFIWDAKTGELLQHCKTPSKNRVESIAFSPDGSQLAGSCERSSLRVWDVHSGRLRYFWNDPGSLGGVLAYSPDGRQLAFGNEKGEVWIRSAETGDYLRQLSGEPGDGRVFFLKYDPESQYLLVGFKEIARLWDVRQERWIQSYSPAGRGRVDMSPDGQWVATGGPDAVYLWDLKTGTLIHRRENIIRLVQLKFLKDEKTLYVNPLRTSFFININTFEENVDWPLLSGRVVDFSNNHQSVLIEQNTGLAIHDLQTGETLREFIGYHNNPRAFAFSPDETELTAGYGGASYIWDIQSGTISHVLSDSNPSCKSIQYSPDGERILTAMEGGDVIVWDREGSERQRIENKASLARWVDRERILVLGSQNRLSLWNTANSNLIHSATIPLDLIDQLAVSPSGDAAAIHSDAGGYRIYSIPSLEETASIPAFDYYDTIVGFTPDGRSLAVHGRSEVQVWSLETQTIVDRAKTQLGWIIQTQYSPQRNEYLSILGSHGSSQYSDGRTYRAILSNLKHEQDILIYQQDNLEAVDAKLSPNETLLATQHFYQGIRIWPVSRIPTNIVEWMMY